MAKTLHIYSHIQTLRERYYSALPGRESLVKIVTEAEVPEQVYNSNAIESSTLTLEETEKILLKIDLDRYASEREIFETRNLARVVEYIDARAKEIEPTPEVILFLHKMLLSSIRDDVAGRFRIDNEWVRVGSHIGADPKEVLSLVVKALTTYHATAHEHIVKRIARLHLAFEGIHPFVDGNGRIGRALNNYLLVREGYVPINIAFSDRARYYEAFKLFEEKKDSSVMEEIVGKALAISYHKRLAYLEGKDILTLSVYAKKYQLAHAGLINKAKRQTIEAFLEKGVWKIAVPKK